jgi:raffinose/stachyose/melibiose transport system substrate-binding protein
MAIALTGALLLTAAACGSSSNTSGGTTSGGSHKTVVTVWSWFVQSTMQKAINAYEKAHPNVEIKYTYYNYDPQYLTALKAAAHSGTLPDIIGLQPGSVVQQYRTDLAPLNSLAAKTWGANWTKLVYPVDLHQLQMGNPAGDHNYYMIPQESQVLAVWYNTQLFAKYHLTVPTTVAQLTADTKTLNSHGIIGFYQGAAGAWQNENVFIMLADQNAANVFEQAQLGKTPWTSAPLVSAMTTWKSLFTSKVFQSGALGAEAYPTGAQLFAAGRVGMITLGSWWLQEPQLAPPVPPLVEGMKGFSWFAMPSTSSSNTAGPVVGGVDVGDGLTKTGAKNPAAWPFLASLVDGVAQKGAAVDLNDLPAFTNVSAPKLAPKIVSLYKSFLTQLPKAQNQRFYSPVVQTALDNALAGVASGQLTPASALAKVQAAQKQVGS